MIDVSGFAERKLKAMRCYRSQKHMQQENPSVIRDILNAKERFHRAFPAFGGEEIEDRLYAGAAIKKLDTMCRWA